MARGSAGDDSSSIVYYVREGAERFLVTDIYNPAASNMSQSSVPVMFDAFVSAINAGGNINSSKIATRYNHVPGGSNVLFMDGHVEFIKYKQGHPISQYLAVESFSGTRAPSVSGGGFFDDLTAVAPYL